MLPHPHLCSLLISITITQGQRVALNIRNEFKSIENLWCCCPDTEVGSSVACCARFKSIDGIQFQTRDILSQADTSWDLSSSVLEKNFDEILESEVLSRDLWASSRFTSSSGREFTTDEMFELRNAYLFDFTKPVREYSTNEVENNMSQNTL